MIKDQKVIFSGIQPSGRITLGNYLGAVKNWAPLQEEGLCLYCVADLHAITVRQNPAELRQRSLTLYAQLLASGIDPEKSILFIQSHVAEHAELAWILNCYTMFGELSRMTQFKDKSAKNADNINCGLFAYPALMAADILLYQTDLVPVGVDQKQHVELTRDIAGRFNGLYSETFTVPEPLMQKSGAKIMSLSDPTKKMSKSDPNPKSYVLLMDSPDEIMRKFKSAVTDSESTVRRGEGRDGIGNLITIYSVAAGKTPEEVEAEFEGRGYGDFKKAVGEATVELLRPVRERTEELLKNKDYLEESYKAGAEKAARLAVRTLDKVKRKVGFAGKIR